MTSLASIAEDDLVPAVRELLRRAVLTLAVLPDPDRRFTHARVSKWPEIVRTVHEAYGWAPPRVRKFQPEPQDVDRYLEVLGWLAWYGREVDDDGKWLIIAWAMGAPTWRLGERFGVGEKQVYRRIDFVAERIGRYAIEKRAA